MRPVLAKLDLWQPMRPASVRGRWALMACACWVPWNICHGQEQPAAGLPAAAAAEEKVQLNLPNQSELSLLIEYVSQRLGVKILYDEQVANKQITIKAPGEIPAASLLDVLQSALKIK
jgi:hypothetical protein